MNALSCSSSAEVNVSALFLVPIRYMMTCLAAVVCALVGSLEYLASRLVTVAISGLVEILSQLREPTIDWKCLMICC